MLELENIAIGFETDHGLIRAVDRVTFSVPAGKTVGLVGESGCGKSVTALSIMGLLPQPMGKLLKGSIKFDGQELTTLGKKERQASRGKDIAMIFQEPMTALNPVQRIGKQLSEAMLLHKIAKGAEATQRSVELLERVGIADPQARLSAYPHQLSGGMRQRVMIAMALSCKPQLLIADEPTTALDVTVQAQILELLADLQKEMGLSILMITHDLGIIAQTCDEVVVMYAGRVVEKGSVEQIFKQPRHAYTKGLLRSMPRLQNKPKTTLPTIPGQVASIWEFVEGCRFCQRLNRSGETLHKVPKLIEIEKNHWVANCPACLEKD